MAISASSFIWQRPGLPTRTTNGHMDSTTTNKRHLPVLSAKLAHFFSTLGVYNWPLSPLAHNITYHQPL